MTWIQQIRQKLPSCFWVISIFLELSTPTFMASASPTVSNLENRTISQVNFDPANHNSAEGLTCFRDILISPQPPSPSETESVEENLPANQIFSDSEKIFPGSDFQEIVTPRLPLNPLIPLSQNGGEVIIWTEDTKIFSIQDGVKDYNGAFVEVSEKQNRSSQSSNCSDHTSTGSR